MVLVTAAGISVDLGNKYFAVCFALWTIVFAIDSHANAVKPK